MIRFRLNISSRNIIKIILCPQYIISGSKMSVPIFQWLKFHHLIKMVLPGFSTVKYLFLFLICAECYFEIVSISCSLITFTQWIWHLLMILMWTIYYTGGYRTVMFSASISPAICICVNSYSWNEAFPSASFLQLSLFLGSV